MVKAESGKFGSSAVAVRGQGLLYNMQIGCDGSNDPIVTIYDGESATNAKEIVPTCTYDASALGMNGFTSTVGKKFIKGLYVEITCGGTVEVILDWEKF